MCANGKGDTYRPVDRAKYEKNYEKIFGKEKQMETLETLEIGGYRLEKVMLGAWRIYNPRGVCVSLLGNTLGAWTYSEPKRVPEFAKQFITERIIGK